MRNSYRYIPEYINFYYCLIYLKPFKLLLFSFIILLLQATRGARNPNLWVVITHAHVCSYAHIPRPVSAGVENVASIHLDFPNEWNAYNAI